MRAWRTEVERVLLPEDQQAIANRFMIIPFTVPIVPAPSNFEFFLGKTIP